MFADLQDKRVLVTAAGAGLGRAICEAFLAAGARVHGCDIDAGGWAGAPPSLALSRADIAVPEDVDHLFDEALARLGGLDVLVNNAGISGPTAGIEDVEVEDWRRTIAVNLDGQFLCIRRAVPLLRAAGGGSIVNIASTAGLMGYPLRTAYAASKWAVVGLTRSLAMELGPYGIRVNAICPGSLEGARMDRVIVAEAAAKGVAEAEIRESYLRLTSLRTFIDPADIANMVLFVCSEAGRKITGQPLCVDGNTETLGN